LTSNFDVEFGVLGYNVCILMFK